MSKQRGRPAHAPTEETRDIVKAHAVVGTPRDVIASIIGITADTLAKHYRPELDESMAKCCAAIAGALYGKAMSGDVTAMIFWLKTRARWREERAESPESATIADSLREIAKKLPV